MRLAELIGTFSLATDAGTGVPEEHGLRSAALAVRVGELAGCDAKTCSDAFYLTLLRFAGCSAGADVAARVLSDELDFAKHGGRHVDYGRLGEMLPAIVSSAMRSGGITGVLSALSAIPQMPEVGRQHCETAVLLAKRMGFDDDFQAALQQGFERWDGSGQPTRARAEAIALPMRLAAVALDADRGYLLGGADAAVAFVKKHSGRELEPRLARIFIDQSAAFQSIFDNPSGWAAALASEPEPQRALDDAGFDAALTALADFADLKSRYTRGHSRGVAELASLAAAQLGVAAELEKQVYRAGLVHDVGRVAVSALIWDKSGALTDAERERIRLHSYVGERILSRAPALREIADIASLTHERLDGSGYHRRLGQADCTLAARLLAAADMYQALTGDRPHRPARSREEAARELRAAVRSGALAADAVEAVLGASGHRAQLPEQESSLTARELEVLALVARGLTNKEIGSALDISAKTAGRHLEHIYEKLSVTTRAGAVVTALSRGLLKS